MKRFGRGFVYAWNGIRAAVQEERNFRFHLAAAVFVYLFSWLAELDATGLALVSLCVFAVMGMELMNSAVERAVDKPDTSHWWSAGAAKDMAAGAVLVMALGTVAVAVCLFGRVEILLRVWEKISRPAPLLGLLALFAAAYTFVFHFPNFQKKGN